MLYFLFQAMSEAAGLDHVAALNATLQGVTEEVIFPGKDYAEAERLARTVLGARYRGATTSEPTQVLIIRI